ncbi:MAG: lysozyme [Lachnospiraceae bacterium]|nr:lysozyme [Lachnospiraceae bacterium]
MKTGQAGVDLIKIFEGCRLTAYQCPAGVPTIGYGHTTGVKMGQKITQEQAEEYLRQDLAKYEKNVEKYDSRYQWNQNEFDAMVSFSYNLGNIDQLTASGSRSKSIIAEKMLLYNKAGGKVLDGLTRRRKAERDLFLKPCAAADTKVQSGSRTSYYPKYTGKATLLVALKACGCTDTSKPFRAKIAVKNGITKSEADYKGTYGQNTKMLELLKQGKLIKA